MAKRPTKDKAKVKHDPRDMAEKPTNEVQTGEKKLTKEQESRFLEQVRKNAVYAQTAWKAVYDNARADLKFLAGDQWPDNAKQQRAAEERPMLTFNDLGQYVDQVVNDGRQNRPSINVAPGDDNGGGVTYTTEKGSTYDVAEVFDGIIRHIESQSQADSHYDTAGQHAIEAGFGWLRVLNTYAKPTSFDLDLRVKSVRNRFAVLLDPDFEEPDASDANWGFIFDEMTRAAYDQLYPHHAVGALSETGPLFIGKEKVAVAEYFERYALRRELLLFSNGEIGWMDDNKDVIDDLEAGGVTIVRRREVDTYKVRWFKLTANAILRGPVATPFSTLPIVPVFGKELNIDGVSDYRGMVRHAKDPKRAENYWLTSATERVAMAPNAPWVGTAKNFENRHDMWANANKGTPAFLIYEKDGESVPKRQDPPTMPVAELQMAATMTDKVKSTIGMYNASVGAQSNETSGKAITARQKEADVGAYTFADNRKRSIRRIGLLLVEGVAALYDGERQARILKEDGTGDFVTLNKQVVDEATGKVVVVHDLGLGTYDVVVKTGPAYSTLRQEAAEALMEFMRVAPNIGAVIVDKVANVMDWPGAQEIRKRVLHTIPRHMLTDEELEEIGPQQQPEPTPEQQAEMAKSEAVMATADATKMTAEANSLEAQAKMAEIEAGAQKNEDMAQIKTLIEETVMEVLAAAASAPAIDAQPQV